MSEKDVLRREAEHFFKSCVEAIFEDLGLPPKEFAYQVQGFDPVPISGEHDDTFDSCHLQAEVYGGPSSMPITTTSTLLYERGDLYWQVGLVTFNLPDGRCWPFVCSRQEDGSFYVSPADPHKKVA